MYPVVDGKVTFSYDMQRDANSAQLENEIQSLIANIASIKDHLSNWCVTNGGTFKGDQLINSDLDVAIIHDLWNLDKHAKLSKASRSGHDPRIQNIRSGWFLNENEPTGLFLKVGLLDGVPHVGIATNGFGGVDADIFSNGGKLLGTFQAIATRAISAWERLLEQTGVRVSI